MATEQSPAATASNVLIKKATEEIILKPDPRGRVFGIRKPGVLAQFRLVEIMEDTAKNEVYMGMLLPVIYCTSIDGEPIPFPNSKREVEALITRVDEDGIAHISNGLREHFGPADPAKDQAAIKK